MSWSDSNAHCSAWSQQWTGWGEGSWKSHDWRDDEEQKAEEVGQPWFLDAHDLVLEPSCSGPHSFTLVLLHSCTGGPDDWIPFFHRLALPFRERIRAVIPCSPIRLENHYGRAKRLNSWFEYDGNRAKCPDQLGEQRRRVLEIMELERLRLPDANGRRLVLGGLSQGAALAVDCALHANFAVGGVVALRGMALPLESGSGRSEQVEVFAANGGHDWLCPPEEARASYEALQSKGLKVTFDSDPHLAHGCARGKQKLSARELTKVSDFLCRVWKEPPIV
eukprot:TRINITY_DN34102_c0_g1_i1.p1 TRINITY_DN34102_c0_g1~~TRINITY_DN34102_c0_g1_i1.p1  ORF type:complete len:278 (+),score=52.50 TRINITY_DN34102_c0_g1_i1:34-867(+)